LDLRAAITPENAASVSWSTEMRDALSSIVSPRSLPTHRSKAESPHPKIVHCPPTGVQRNRRRRAKLALPSGPGGRVSGAVPEQLTSLGNDGWELVILQEHHEGGMGTACSGCGCSRGDQGSCAVTVLSEALWDLQKEVRVAAQQVLRAIDNRNHEEV
jgi:hypothetical protein